MTILTTIPDTFAQSSRQITTFPNITLNSKISGITAATQLNNRIPELANWYNMPVTQFTNILKNDRTVWLDKRGRVFFEEEVTLPPRTLSTQSIQALEPLDQTFKLHSRPSAKRTIYLNFVGTTLTNTAWNNNNTIIAEPFDLDGVPYSFSTGELQRIQYIWKRVAEAYSAFDVDVTTELPPQDRISRLDYNDDIFGTVVLITRRTFYTCNCGGVAYLSVFDDTSDFFKPALVFFDALGGGNEKYVSDAIIHEAGHNVGLSHDGSSAGAYYSGHGSGPTGWAPVMGVGYYQQLVQWSKGEYSGANNTQDDYLVMQNTGLPVKPDDHGNINSTATLLTSANVNGILNISGSGVIEQPSDIDVFKFVAGAGPLSININPAEVAPMLDILVSLKDSTGNVILVDNPIESLPGTINTNLIKTDTYYLFIDGTGKGDPLGTGYTDYGSIGQYSIFGTATAPVQQPPVAVITANPTSGVVPLNVNFNSIGSYDSDGSIISYNWNFGNGFVQNGGQTAQYTYSVPGTYSASLTVTDNSGLTDTKTVNIVANAVPVQNIIYIKDISLSLTNSGFSRSIARANVTVQDNNGKLISGATVSGFWSGVYNSSTLNANTNLYGVARFTTPKVVAYKGSTFTFTVTNINMTGYTYDSAKNIETSSYIIKM